MEKPRLPGPTPAGLGVEDWKRSIADKLYYSLGRFPAVATRKRPLPGGGARRARPPARALARHGVHLRARGQPHRLLPVGRVPARPAPRQQPAEPRHRGRRCAQAVRELGSTSTSSLAQEEEPGLGNGGLGRLAACYLDSLATLEIPAIGYGIRYEFGIFDQAIRDGWQVEIDRQVAAARQPVGDRRGPRSRSRCSSAAAPSTAPDADGRQRVRWMPERVVKGVAYDTPILGYRVNTANMLRLWSAEAAESFDFAGLQRGRLLPRGRGEDVLREHHQGALPERRDRRRQAAAPRAAVLLRLLLAAGHDPHPPAAGERPRRASTAKYAVQLNDTHPAIAVAELMRLLVDEHAMPVGAGLGDHHPHLRLHQPHAAARGAREVAAAAVPVAAAAPPRDHLRDQPPLPRRGAPALPRRRGARAARCR